MFLNSMFQIGHTKTEVLVNIITFYRIPLGVPREGEKKKEREERKSITN